MSCDSLATKMEEIIVHTASQMAVNGTCLVKTKPIVMVITSMIQL